MADKDDSTKISYSVGNPRDVKVDTDGVTARPENPNVSVPFETSKDIDVGSGSPSGGSSSGVRNAESVGSKGYGQTPGISRGTGPSSGPEKGSSGGLAKKESLGDKPGTIPKDQGSIPEPAPDAGEGPVPGGNGYQENGVAPGGAGASGGEKGTQTGGGTPGDGHAGENAAGMGAAGAQPQLEDKDGLGGKKDDLEKKDGIDDKKDEGKKDEGEKSKPEDPNKPEKKGAENPGEGTDKKPAEKPESKSSQQQQQTGNGYGAVQKNRPGAPTQQQQTKADPTAQARQNHAQQKAAAADRAAERGRSTKKASSGSINKKQRPSMGQRLRNWGRNFVGKRNTDRDMGDTNGDPNKEEKGQGTLGHLKGAIKDFLLRHPFLIIALLLLILMLIIVLLDSGELGGSGGAKHCTYELNGVVSTGTIKVDNLQVELINCDGNAQNYTVLETIDFDKYVVGVALAEVSWHADYPAYFQAQIVAARGFALRRNSAMCPSNPDNCFFGYNAETGKIRLRACTNDQVYCDIDKPCYKVSRSGKPTLYGPEAEGASGATVWKGQLDESTKAAIMAAAEEVKGKVLVDESGNVVYTNFVNTDQNNWWSLAQQGKNYEEILTEHYKDRGATGMNSASCTYYGNIDYGDYELNSEGDTILNERLDKFLEKQGTSLEAFNQLIVSNVEKNGYGTRAGVVAAAVTLIAELGNNYNVKVPYFLSGGHHDGVKTGAVGYWGSGYEDDGRRCVYSGYGNIYTVCGLDCSGFVPWAIKNGGFQVGVNLAGNFQNLSGAQKVSLNSSSPVLEPGDLLESEGHIVLVVGIDENSHQYICAEASGKNAGVLFTRRSYADSGYWGVKMDGYYDTHSLKGK